MADDMTNPGVIPIEDKSVFSKQYAVPRNIPLAMIAFIIPANNFFHRKPVFSEQILKYVPAIIFINIATRRTGSRFIISFIVILVFVFSFETI